MTVLDWRNFWYVKDCCKIGSLCPKHFDKHRGACGSGDGKKCDVCDENFKPK